jgi:hypothetical protein
LALLFILNDNDKKLKIVSIHPFIDGNGRTSRQYQNKREPEPFCDFIAERVYETQKEIMRLLHISIPNLS